MRWRSSLGILCAVLTFGWVTVPAFGANLLNNPGFEMPWGGDKQTITGWKWWAAGDLDLFDGVFDSSWHVPPAQPGWASNYGPHSGTYYLGRYYPPTEPSTGGHSGALGQTVIGLTPGVGYYAECWYATHHPHGGGAGLRIGINPGDVTGPDEFTTWAPAVDPIQGNKFGMSEANYAKLTVGPVTAPTEGSLTVWLNFTTTSNNISEPQIVQVDDVRLATDKSMEIDNVTVIGASATSVKILFDTYDGGTLLPTSGFVDYGATASYGSTGTDTSNPRANHEITLTGLTAGATYHFRCRATASGYENAATADLTFQMYPSLVIKNRVVNTITGSSAKTEWDTFAADGTTPLAADSRVEYGYTNNNYQFSQTDATLVNHHAVTMTGLYPNTTYYYRVVSSAPNFNSARNPASPFTTNFMTGPGAFFNGNFDIVLDPNRNPNSVIPGWSKVSGLAGMQWFNSGEWSIPGQNGPLYIGAISNYGLNKAVVYQKIATTPGEVLSYSTWVWAQSYGQSGGGAPHRFGECAGQIGIDPTGGTDPAGTSIIWSAFRQTQDWAAYSAGNPDNGNAVWQKIGVSTVAAASNATIFLRCEPKWPIAWNMVCFDNVAVEPVADVASIADAKTKDNDTAISLQPANNADCPIVTFVANPNPDSADNGGAPYFYVQDPSRAAGIKVTMAGSADIPANLTVGDRVKLKGCITWGVMQNRIYPTETYDQQVRLNKPCGERVVRASEVTVIDGNTAVDPLGMGNKGVAGGSSADHWFANPGAAGAVGENTVGLLARTWGKILTTGYDQNMGDYIVIDDGSAVPCFSGEIIGATRPSPDPVGLYVFADNDYSADIGKYAVVTGISAVRVDFDWDDPSYSAGVHLPEAMKNVRFFKASEIRVIN